MSATAPTLRDTKQTIYDAYKKVLHNLNEAAAHAVDPTTALHQEKIEATITRADGSLTSENLDQFRKALTTSLGTLSAQMDGVLEEYTSVKEAVRLKKKELEEVFDITVEAQTLAALLDTQRITTQEYEDFSEERKAELEKELETYKEDFEQRAKIQKETNQRAQNIFFYDFERKKTKLNDELNDELNKRRKEHNESINTENRDLDERERYLAEAEKAREALETKIQEMPYVIAAEVKKQVGKEKGMLERQHADAIKLLTSDFHGKQAVKESLLIASQEVTEDLKKKNTDLSFKLDKAYSEMRELAQATVAGPSLADLKDVAASSKK